MFIKIEDNYDPLILYGSGHRLINVNHIIYVTDLSKRKDVGKVTASVKSRIYPITGEYIDTIHSFDKISDLLNVVPFDF